MTVISQILLPCFVEGRFTVDVDGVEITALLEGVDAGKDSYTVFSLLREGEHERKDCNGSN